MKLIRKRLFLRLKDKVCVLRLKKVIFSVVIVLDILFVFHLNIKKINNKKLLKLLKLSYFRSYIISNDCLVLDSAILSACFSKY